MIVQKSILYADLLSVLETVVQKSWSQILELQCVCVCVCVLGLSNWLKT